MNQRQAKLKTAIDECASKERMFRKWTFSLAKLCSQMAGRVEIIIVDLRSLADTVDNPSQELVKLKQENESGVTSVVKEPRVSISSWTAKASKR